MTKTTITTEIHQTLDIHANDATQITLDLVVGFDDFANRTRLSFGEIIAIAIIGNFSFV